MANQKKFCPLMTKGSDAIPCVGERCQWWFKEEGVHSTKYIGNCIVYAYRSSLFQIAQKTK